jgi:cobalt/nickel transport system permease protein
VTPVAPRKPAGWISIVTASFLTALVLGIQPHFFLQNGKPLYFPFGLKVTIPALLIPHILFFGPAEGIFTAIIYKFLKSHVGEVDLKDYGRENS